MARRTNQAHAGVLHANQSPVSGVSVQLAPEKECLVRLRYAHARAEILGLTLRFRLGDMTDIEQFDINPTLEGEARAQTQQDILVAFELLSRLESFYDGLRSMKELEISGDCVGFRLSRVPGSLCSQH